MQDGRCAVVCTKTIPKREGRIPGRKIGCRFEEPRRITVILLLQLLPPPPSPISAAAQLRSVHEHQKIVFIKPQIVHHMFHHTRILLLLLLLLSTITNDWSNGSCENEEAVASEEEDRFCAWVKDEAEF